MTKGYRILKGATTAPKGYKWYWNGNPLFNNGGFHAILIKEVQNDNT